VIHAVGHIEYFIIMSMFEPTSQVQDFITPAEAVTVVVIYSCSFVIVVVDVVTSTDTTTTTDTTTDTVTNLLLPTDMSLIISFYSFANFDCFLPPPFSPVPV
jgi:hypothetical protein